MRIPAKTNTGLGLVSALMTLAVLTAIAAWANLSAVIGRDLLALVTGRVTDIVRGEHDIGAMSLFIVTIITLELQFAIVTALAVNAFIGKGKGKHAVTELLNKLTHGHNFMAFFGFVLIEELGARGLFLGLIPWLGRHVSWLTFLAEPVVFYVLFLVGNGLWAAIHLANYAKEDDRNPLRALSQFVGGVFYTYVFVKYGLLAVILTHFGSNAVLFALHKRQRLNHIDALITLYSAISAGVSWLLMDKPLTDAAAWLRPVSSFALLGWGLWDYVLLYVFVCSCLGLLFSLLLYDHGEAGTTIPKKPDTAANKPGLLMKLLAIPVGIFIAVGALFGLYWALSFATEDTLTRVLLVSIVFTLIHEGASGSAVARTFWGGLPSTFVLMCILQALGFWYAIAFIAIVILINYPVIALCTRDD